jgi:regulator of sirC expression with transglutaminase-like and TPR domain
MPRRLVALLLATGTLLPVRAAGPGPAPSPVEELTRRALDSVVVVYQQGRDADVGATGTGFVVAPDGLIATNWHVINDRRDLEVELRDGTVCPVTAVHASDRRLDLALIRVDAGKPLPALPLGDSDALAQGQAVIALGNPRGLKFSVVEGVISGFRDDVGESPFPYLQLAIPVEEGNSGGPVLDLEGRVQGIVTMKSMVTRNLGFAMPSNALKLLLDEPNPIPMETWATVGRLDPARWTPVFGAQWSQRAGRILVRGSGDGFGGRSLCLRAEEPPGDRYDVAVEVKLDDESGAAGLAFAADGGDRHYGFYPSGGRLRLTRFDGPDVESWTILGQYDVPAYVPGEWNRLRVRIEPERITCFVNDTEVASVDDAALRGGRPGLCKFRRTEAEFRRFAVAPDLGTEKGPDAAAPLAARVVEFVRQPESPPESLMDAFLATPDAALAALAAAEKQLAREKDRLDRLHRTARARIIGNDIATALGDGAGPENLLLASLLVSRLDNPDLDPQGYLEMADDMAGRIRRTLPEGAGEDEIVQATLRFMFEESGFHGSRLDYYHRSNSYLNEVLDDREGIPITLSIVFVELARRSGAATVRGVGLPGHFVAGYTDKEGTFRLLDIYEGGTPLTEADARERVLRSAGRPLAPEDLAPASGAEIVLRMLRNLIEQQKQAGTPAGALPYLEVSLQLRPDDAAARFDRALLRYQEGDVEGTKTDLRWLLQAETPGINRERLRSFYESL